MPQAIAICVWLAPAYWRSNANSRPMSRSRSAAVVSGRSQNESGITIRSVARPPMPSAIPSMQAIAVRLRGKINPEPISPAGMTSRYGFPAPHAVALNYAIAGHWQREGPGMGEPIRPAACVPRPSPEGPVSNELDRRISHLDLAPLPSAPAWARRHAGAGLNAWQIGPDTIETAQLIVSELVTNAIKAANPRLVRPGSSRSGQRAGIPPTLALLPGPAGLEVFRN